MPPSEASITPPCPCRVTRWPSPNMTLSTGSSSREGISTGRCAASSERSATRAERLAERTELNVATASTSVPPAVASEEIVTQSVKSGGALEPLLQPRERARVALAHAHRHERRHQLEEAAG